MLIFILIGPNKLQTAGAHEHPIIIKIQQQQIPDLCFNCFIVAYHIHMLDADVLGSIQLV